MTGAAALLAALVFAAPAMAQPVFAVSAGNLVTFDTETPGTVTTVGDLTDDLQGGETIVAMDFNEFEFPAELYAVGSTSRLYRINTSTTAATQIGSTFTNALSGTSFGFTFSGGLGRLVSDADQHLVIDPATGADTAHDPLDYDITDVNDLANPNVVALALHGERVLGIDSTLNILARLGSDESPPEDGTLLTLGSLGVNPGAAASFDVTGGGNAYAILDVGSGPELFLVDVESGAATPYPDGASNNVGAAIGGTMAVQPQFPQLQASPSPWAFGDQPLGTMGPVTTVTLTLTGGDALHEANPSFSGPHEGDFFLTANLCQAGLETQDEEIPLRLPGDSCTMQARFAPGALGARTATLNLNQPKCCPSDSFLDIPVTGNGTSGPFGPVGATGPTGPAGPQGPPGAAAIRLLALLGNGSYSVRTTRSLRVRFVTTDGGLAKLEVLRGTRVLVRLQRRLAGGGKHTLAWNGRPTTGSAGARRRPRGLPAGRYSLRLTVTGADRQVARDTARLRIRR